MEKTEQGICKAHFGETPDAESASMLMPQCVNDYSKLKGKGLAINFHISNNAKTHKKQIMFFVSKGIKILGRCCRARWPHILVGRTPCLVTPTVPRCSEQQSLLFSKVS